MKVLCVSIINSISGAPTLESASVTLHSEYVVLSIVADPDGSLQFQIMTDDRHTPAWFDAGFRRSGLVCWSVAFACLMVGWPVSVG